MIDAWMIFTMMVPFMEVVLHTAIKYLTRKIESEACNTLVVKRQRKLNQINSFVTYGLPFCVLMFLIFFFLTGFILSKKLEIALFDPFY